MEAMAGNEGSSTLELARKRHAESHGPPIAFKRSRRILPNDVVGAGNPRAGTAAAGGPDGDRDGNPYGRCPDVSSRYEKLDRIGEGTYGVVYRARDRDTGEVVALKRCLPHHERSDGFPLTTLREISALRELAMCGHPGIVRLRDVAVSSSRSGVFLVFEYCEHDLADLLDAHYATRGASPFKEGEVKRLAAQLLSAVSFLHSRHYLHRDIKMSNLLYNHRGELRLADFGLARRVGRTISAGCAGQRPQSSLLPHPDSARTDLTPKVVSLWYRPPELLLGSDLYDGGVDCWGAGCVIAELLKGVPLLKGKNEMDQIGRMFDLLGPPDPSKWPGLSEMPLVKSGSLEIPHRAEHAFSSSRSSNVALLDCFEDLSIAGIDLLLNLLQYNPASRWTADQALTSEYFTERPLPTNRSLMPTFPTTHGK